MKTPKQIKRWIHRARLRPEGNLLNGKGAKSRNFREGCLYLQGRGRRWRIVNGYLDISSLDFDRWANSTESRMILPSCEEDFVNTVKGFKINESQ